MKAETVAKIRQLLNKHKLTMDSENNRPGKGALIYAPANSYQRIRTPPKGPHMIFPNLYHLLLVLAATLLYASLSVQADKAKEALSIGNGSELGAGPQRARSSSSVIKGESIRRRDNYDSDEDTDLARDDPSFITKKPRQQFKVYLGPNKSHKTPFKSMVAKRSHSNLQVQTPADTTKPVRNATASNAKALKAKSGKQMLSSDTLKKLLLNQSLLPKGSSNLYYSPGALNGTSDAAAPGSQSGKAGSNFKFVFIQRATAAPNKGNATKGDSGSSSTSPSNQSLAASVSKQLASSLLYTASNLVGNLTGAPSLSALTNAVAIKSGASQPADLGEEGSNDIRRVHSAPAPAPPAKPQGAGHAQPGSLYVSTPSHGRKQQKPSKRPSKVYNLPVKFVSNGQPNGVVFNTIKQHFATIRKMQSAVAAASASSVANRKTNTFAGSKDRRKQQQQQMADKKKGGLKGTNSRLIYLPLKYISNAKPDRLISPKAAHKSISTTRN